MSNYSEHVDQSASGRKGRRWGAREFLLTATAMAAVLAIGASMQLVARGGPATKPETIALAQASSMAEPDAEQMKAMTEAVLQSLGAVTGAGKAAGAGATPQAQQAAPQGAQDYAQLMQTLGEIVRKATVQGKSSQEIVALIEQALAEQDQEQLDALLQQAGGKVGLHNLLVSLVQKAAMETSVDDPYVKALQAEGTATRVAEDRTHSRAPTTGVDTAGRTIVVQPGDTLSLIARRVYGSASKWRVIFEANRDKLRDPDFVRVGMRLRVP